MYNKPRLYADLNRLMKDGSGGVAIMFAFFVMGLLLFIGIAVDFGGASSLKTKLQIKTDSALLAGAKTYQDNPSNINKVIQEMDRFLKTEMPDASFDGQPQITSNGDLCVTTKTNYKTLIMSIIGYNNMLVRNYGCVRAPVYEYIDFYILMDNSPSMGLAATETDIRNIMKATYNTRPDGTQGCAFACHFSDSNSRYVGFRTHAFAKAGYDLTPLSQGINGQVPAAVLEQYLANPPAFAAQRRLQKITTPINLRIDVVQKSVENLLKTARQKQRVPGQYRFAVYSFGKECINGSKLTPVPGLGTPVDVDNAEKLLKNNPVTLMDANYPGANSERCTDFTKVFSDLNNGSYKIPNGGKGTMAQPVNFVFFVSDGTTDAPVSSGNCEAMSATKYTQGTIYTYEDRCLSPINVSKTCALLKENPRNIRIASLYTTYLPLDNSIISGTYNDFYVYTIKPFNAGPYSPASVNSKIHQFMEECATPGYFFEVTPNQGIDDAMQALFKKVISDKITLSK